MATDPFINYDLQNYVVYTFATLPPAASVPGMRLEISDSTIGPGAAGTLIVGGGAIKIKVQSDGAAWRAASNTI